MPSQNRNNRNRNQWDFCGSEEKTSEVESKKDDMTKKKKSTWTIFKKKRERKNEISRKKKSKGCSKLVQKMKKN